jgi:hypothetical protein
MVKTDCTIVDHLLEREAGARGGEGERVRVANRVEIGKQPSLIDKFGRRNHARLSDLRESSRRS